MSKQRSLKVHYRVRYNAFRKAILYPEIRLKGLWLKDAGIRIGEVVHVDIVDGTIKISHR